MKKIYLTLLFSFVLISCDYTTSKELPVTEEEVLGVFNEMFNALDNDLDSYKNYVTDDPYNPYANYYLGSFYNHKGDFNKSRFHFTRISDSPNFSRNWYTVESEQFLNELKSFIDKE